VTISARQTDPAAVEAVDALISQLGSITASRRHDAARALKHFGATAIGPIVHRLTRESQARQNNALKSFALFAGGAVFYLWLAPRLVNPANWPLLIAFLPITLIIMRLNAWSRLHIEAVRLLSQIDDVRAVGPLADALESRDLWVVSSTRTLAAEALVRLLPRVTVDDEALLNSSQRECLYRALDHAGLFDADLSSAVIRVMGRIGDGHAEKPLRKLIQNRYFIGRHSELHIEAETALEAIRQRVAQAQAPEMLLRAAALSYMDDPDSMLRAVHEGSDAHPELLLRSDGDATPSQISVQQSLEEADAAGAGGQTERLPYGTGNIGVCAANPEIDAAIEARTVSQ